MPATAEAAATVEAAAPATAAAAPTANADAATAEAAPASAIPSPPVRRRHDPEGRRRAILTAAAELVIENGAAALTHRAIAKRAGVALGSTTQYFSSIDELREAALELLAEQIDEELAEMQHLIDEDGDDFDRLAEAMHRFLLDSRQVHADIALMTAGTTDARMRALALRWFDRMVDMIAARLGRERAIAIATYLDGATMHAALHDAPISPDHLADTLRALAAMPTRPENR
ncbi:TetR family transcriptional regulator [Leucobacter sp. CSA1]|uniref:TetR family transcriptional regulator n=1 Tax=Leucobacter chromiisoli TaxID=2796471 RepID=A0A934Q5F1_9MICO|nr:TetR family transcriptional regulator [Leucobacter chromiisoli]MBK0417926.1 TetR family transcriptional regulator [Leucobacter chromiisoli]